MINPEQPAGFAKRLTALQREELGGVLGITVDPIGKWDDFTIIAGSSLFGVTLLMLIYAWLNNSYAPIRAKNVRVTTLMYIGAVMWFVGDIATNGHVELVGAWAICKLWCVWIRVCFAYTFSAAAALRIYALYRVFILHRPYSGFSSYLPILIIFGCLLVFCVVSQVVSDSVTVMYVEEYEVCTYVWAFRGACLGLLWMIWLLVLFFVVKIRNIHSSFNERYESFLICLLAFTAVTNTTLLHTIRPNYPLELRYRLANTWIDILVSNFCVWVVILYPCYQSVFHREAYLQTWTTKLKTDGLRKEYNMSPQHGSTVQGYSMMGSDSENKQIISSTMRWAAANGASADDAAVMPDHIQLSEYPSQPYDSRRII
ncbi:hypothetical protein GQ54DRAFT_298330 [Martensiomyces pterosporus]|nr:hypothetical protein GQ54DRAFT_298330 [Martensiomyces pterosporus]